MNRGTTILPTEDRMVSITEGFSMVGVKKTAGYSWINDGILPPPRILSERRRGWLHSELLSWMRNRPTIKPVKKDKKPRRVAA